MALVDKLVCTWTGFVGAPGYSVFYADNGPYGVRAQIVAFFTAIKGEIPPVVTVNIPTQGETYDVDTGELQSSGWISGSASAIVGSAPSVAFAAPTGAFVSWKTPTIAPAVSPGKRPRRVHGGTYLVPLSGQANQSDGTLATTSLNVLQTAANSLVSSTGGHLVVWAKPHYTDASPPVRDRIGTRHTVTNAIVADKWAVLRSRRQ